MEEYSRDFRIMSHPPHLVGAQGGERFGRCALQEVTWQGNHHTWRVMRKLKLLSLMTGPVRHGMVIRLLKEMQHITHEDTGFAGLQALGESAVFCETGFGQDYVTSEQIMKALETVGHPFRLEDVSELHAISSNEHLNFVVAVIGPWVQLKRSWILSKASVFSGAASHPLPTTRRRSGSYWLSKALPGCLWAQLVTLSSGDVTDTSFKIWVPSWKGSCNLRLLLASTMSAHLDKAQGFLVINFPWWRVTAI